MYAHRMASIVRAFSGSDIDYERALRWQRATAAAVRSGAVPALALIQHTPVYTMGRRGGRASLAVAPDALRAPVIDVERGGDITWHGPGQLVGYPILDLRAHDLQAADYVHRLERVLVDALNTFNIDAGAVAGRPGVWVQGEKVAAIGVAVRGGVTMHGFALNVSPDLTWFDDIVPCGLADTRVTSLQRILGVAPAMPAVIDAVRTSFAATFDITLVEGGLIAAAGLSVAAVSV